ncbi:MAG: hypothetical protein K9L22_12755 [Methylococcaceae bacterium]|nr:hypothetical protein [Methylococcaceae bacterium]
MKISAKLGTFAGVFTPSILTILGIILFLRLGYIVGTAGLAQTLIILILANSISVLSSLSLAAISTNLHVKVGGIYYLISRTLGHAFGGAIGIVLFLAQAISIGFYCLGFAEILITMLPNTLALGVQSLAAIAIVVLGFFAWLGADWANRVQFVVMSILALAIGSFFWGAAASWSVETLASNWVAVDENVRFWVMFALFFPAVTGFTQGVNMSGDLKNPTYSLPVGTFSAVFLSIAVYLLAVFFYAGSITKTDLINIANPMTQVAAIDYTIVAGVFAATLSSALASFLGAPRVLQSLASDRLWQCLLPFAKGVGETNNPQRGVLLSAVIALLTVFMGQLDVIAPVVSMFFLISYGLINFATYFEASSESPSFRPSFRWFNKNLSLLGGTLCLGAMLAINIFAGVVALAILVAIYYYLRNTGMRSRWADGWRSFHLFRVREHLLAAYKSPEHPRDWRPNILLFPIRYPGSKMLYQFASLLEVHSGFTTVVKIVQGSGAELVRRRQQEEAALLEELQQQELQAFPLVLAAPSISTGIHTLIQAHGIGPLRANTILLPWQIKGDSTYLRPSIQHLRVALKLQCNLLILVEPQSEVEISSSNNETLRIDIWWSGGDSSHLALLLAFLMKRNEAWEGSQLRLLCLPVEGKDIDTEALKQHLIDIRIPATFKLVANISYAALQAESVGAAMVFLPFKLHQQQFLTMNGDSLEPMLLNLPPTILTLASHDFELDTEPETGTAADSAGILDALEDARDLCDFFQQQVAKLQKEKAQLLDKEDEESEDSADDLAKLEIELQKVIRRHGKAKAKLIFAEKLAESLPS